MTIRAELKEDYEGDIPLNYNSSFTCFDATCYTYDNKGRVATETYPNGESNAYTYDARGNVLTETNNYYEDEDDTVLTSEVTAYTYDAQDNLLSTLSGNDSVQSTYDSAGRLLLTNDNGECTRNVYDNKGRLIQIIDPDDYNADDDNLSAGTYANSNVGIRYTYNEKDQIISEINKIGVETTYTYHCNGVKATEIFDIYEFDYNELGNIDKIWVARSSNSVPYAEYEYNGGSQITINDPNETDTNGENANIQITSNPIANEMLNTAIQYGNGQKVIYEYSNGRLTSQSFKESDSSPVVTQFAYSYNNDDEQNKKYDFVNNQIYVYTENTTSVYTLTYANGEPVEGQLISSHQETEHEDNEATENVDESYTTHTNTTGSSTLTSEYTNNSDSFTTTGGSYVLEKTEGENSYGSVLKDSNNNALLSYTVTENDNTSDLNITYRGNYENTYRYTYDDKGRLTSSCRTYNGNTVSGTVNNYYYDNKGQLVRADNSTTYDRYTRAYSYDSRGNLRRMKDYSYTTGELDEESSDAVVRLSYDDTDPWSDKLSGIEEYDLDGFLYDENGNLLNFEDLRISWTNGRQLSGVYSEDEQGNLTELASYTYDDKGIRTSKTVNGVTTYYTYIDGNITSQYQLDENGNITNLMEFMYSSDNEIIGFTYGGEAYFYVKNLQGDVTQIINSSGNSVAYYNYTEFGDIDYISSAPNSIRNINPIRYRSYYFDSLMGMYYLQSRYYLPAFCRFINADEPEYARVQKDDYAGTNLFAYCCNDPVNNVDYDGRVRSSKKKVTITVMTEKNGKRNGVSTHAMITVDGFTFSYGPYANSSIRKYVAVTGYLAVGYDNVIYNYYKKTEKRYMRDVTFYVSEQQAYDMWTYFTDMYDTKNKLKDIKYKNQRAPIYKVTKGDYKYYSISVRNCTTIIIDCLKYAMYSTMTNVNSKYPGDMNNIITPDELYNFANYIVMYK